MTETKKKAAKSTSSAAKDTGSTSAQIRALTARINELTDHLKTNKKDHMARRGLLIMVGRRKRLLKYLAAKDTKSYLALVQELGLRK